MQHYEALVYFLGEVLGKNYEIALLDLREDKKCITAIANGHISGRQINSPITNLAASILNSESWKEKDFECNYKGIAKDKKTLRSSTFFIKENGNILGMLCINADDSAFLELSGKILQLGGVLSSCETTVSENNSDTAYESFSENIEDIIDSHMLNCSLYDVSGERLTQNEKMEIVESLLKSGIFQIRGAVTNVAERLRCSEATVYRYMSKIQKRSNLKSPVN